MDEVKDRRGGCRTLIDLAGCTFGRLTVLERVPNDDRYSQPRPLWLCQCECGNQTVVLGANLRAGMTRSCGCLRREVSAANRKKKEGKRW